MAKRDMLQGGVANAGAVVREGDVVLRPAGEHSVAIHALFRHVRASGFDGVPEPVGIGHDGLERLVFISGDVAIPPYPAWSQSDEALASVAELLRRFHVATTGFESPPETSWNRELADPIGGDVVCHNDVCLENVVFRNGVAVTLLDFDFAAPGRPVHDVAAMARMCVPLDASGDTRAWDRRDFDPFRRLRLVADSYGLPPGRGELLQVIEESMEQGSAFVRHRVQRGDQAFVKMWKEMGGQARYDRRRQWFEANRPSFLDALG